MGRVGGEETTGFEGREGEGRGSEDEEGKDGGEVPRSRQRGKGKGEEGEDQGTGVNQDTEGDLRPKWPQICIIRELGTFWPSRKQQAGQA